jgi:hypothetical protein
MSGLIETEVSELRGLLTEVMDGKVTIKQAAMQLAIYSEIYKRERLMFDIWKASGRQKGILQNATSKNLLGNGAITVAKEVKPKNVLTVSTNKLIIDALTARSPHWVSPEGIVEIIIATNMKNRGQLSSDFFENLEVDLEKFRDGKYTALGFEFKKVGRKYQYRIKNDQT